MTPADVTNEIVQILGSPAWSGAWTTIGVTISIIALRKSNLTQSSRPRLRAPLKKSYLT